MDENDEILNYIYQNCEMGRLSTEQIINKIEDEELKDVLTEQIKVYTNILNETEDMLDESKKQISKSKKMMLHMSIDMSLMKDKASSHIAQMLIQGSNMGIIDVTKLLNSYKGADMKIRNLAKRLGDIQKKNIEDLKKFLIKD